MNSQSSALLQSIYTRRTHRSSTHCAREYVKNSESHYIVVLEEVKTLRVVKLGLRWKRYTNRTIYIYRSNNTLSATRSREHFANPIKTLQERPSTRLKPAGRLRSAWFFCFCTESASSSFLSTFLLFHYYLL